MRPTFRELLRRHGHLVMPSAFDAMSARLVEAAGFSALSISGSAMLAARYGLPDIGLAGLTDMLLPTRDIVASTDLAILGDADDGYGDLAATMRTVRESEATGLGAIMIEDQDRQAKKPGQGAATEVVAEDAITAKLRIAVQTRDSSDFWIMGRTDANTTLGLDAALRRADLFLKAGVDGVFIAGLRTEADMVKVAESLRGVPLVAAIYGRPGWPSPSIRELVDLGYTNIIYPLSLVMPACKAIGDALADLMACAQAGSVPQVLADDDASLDYFAKVVRQSSWQTDCAPEQPGGS